MSWPEWTSSDGRIRLVNADCLDAMPTLDAGSVDAIIADLPYGTTACKWDTVIPFEPLWANYRHVAKRNAAIVLTASQPFTSALVMSNPKCWRHEWVWIKNRGSNFGNTVREPFKEHETVQVFSSGGWLYNKQMQSRTGGGLSRVGYKFTCRTETENYGKFGAPRENQGEFRVPSSWQKFNTETGLHPTQKPVTLMEYLIRTYTNEGELVLDNTMGSGTTGVACLQTGRRFIGIEKDREIFQTAVERVKAEYARTSLLDGVAVA